MTQEQTQPNRIQRKRSKGWRMPPNTIYVGRPSKWGNPLRARTRSDGGRKAVLRAYRQLIETGAVRVANHMTISGADWETHRQYVLENISQLRGKDLACWCSLDQACHADVLLELANREVA